MMQCIAIDFSPLSRRLFDSEQEAPFGEPVGKLISISKFDLFIIP
jgi:hypothetical protein